MEGRLPEEGKKKYGKTVPLHGKLCPINEKGIEEE